MFLEHRYTLDDLIKRCKAGERKAQELLYHQFASKMLGVCFRYAADRMEAEDMLQTGFIKVFEKMGDFRGDGSFEGGRYGRVHPPAKPDPLQETNRGGQRRSKAQDAYEAVG